MYYILVLIYIYNMLWRNDFCYNIFLILNFFQWGSNVIYLKSDRLKWLYLPTCCAIVFDHFFSRLTLKEAISEARTNVINQGSIDVVSHIYHPTPPTSPTPMIKQIKIFIYLVILTVVPEKDAMVLTVITLHKMFTELFLQQQ